MTNCKHLFSGCVDEKTYIDKKLDLVFLKITANLGCQEDAGSSAEFAVLFVQLALKNEFFEVDESHGHSRLLVPAFILGQFFYLSFQAVKKFKFEEEKGIKKKIANTD